MTEIRKFISDLKSKSLAYDSMSIRVHSQTDFKLLKAVADELLTGVYVTYMVEKEYGHVSDADFKSDKKWELMEQIGNFGLKNKLPLCEKYPISFLLSDTFIQEAISKNFMHRKIRTLDNLLNIYEISINCNPRDIEMLYLKLNNKIGFSVERLKKIINNEFIYSNFSVSPEKRSKYSFKMVLNGEEEYFFKGGSFLSNWRSVSYEEFRALVKEYDLNQSELLSLILNVDQLYSQNIGTTQNNNKESFSTVPILINENLEGDFTTPNNNENEITNILKGNLANGKVSKSIITDNGSIHSQFTDFQAFHICRGIKGQEPLYNKYIKNKHNDTDIFKAHNIAMKTLEKYGREMIGFLFSLPKLPFNCPQFSTLFSSLDKAMLDGNQNPVIKFRIKNVKGQYEDIEYSFYHNNNNKYINQIRVRNKTAGFDLLHVSREGKVLVEENVRQQLPSRNIMPVLEFFYTITQSNEEFQKAVISYGQETGNCSLCGRELTDKISKMKGIGPVCEKYIM